MREYLQSHSFITHSQSAFMKLHSTQTSLHNVIEYVLDNINENEINGICMFDLAKCFDTIDHKLLLKKLANMALVALNYNGLQIISMNELKLLP